MTDPAAKLYQTYRKKCQRYTLHTRALIRTFVAMTRHSIRGIGVGFLLGIYLAASTPVGELLKFPVLIEHFREHCREKTDTSVIGFIVLHYFSGSPRDADYERDMQLPFKTLEVMPLALSATHFPPVQAPALVAPPPAVRKALPPLALLFPPHPYLPTLTEPPEA